MLVCKGGKREKGTVQDEIIGRRAFEDCCLRCREREERYQRASCPGPFVRMTSARTVFFVMSVITLAVLSP